MNQRTRKSFDELTIIDDYMFFRVMQDTELCKELLRRILKSQIGEITSVEAQKDFKETYASHGVRVDILVKTADGKVYDIEMQAARRKDLAKRIRYYQSALDSELLDKNQRYTELPDTFIIFLCPFDPLNKGLPLYTFKTVCTEDADIRLEDGTTKVILNSTASDKEESQELKAVLDYINGKVTDDPYIAKLEKAVTAVKQNDMWREYYMNNTAWYQDAVEEGIEQGIEQGIQQGMRQGMKQGVQQGRQELLDSLVREGILTEEDAARRLNLSLEEFQAKMHDE